MTAPLTVDEFEHRLLPPPIDEETELRALGAILTEQVALADAQARLKTSCFTGTNAWLWERLPLVLAIDGWVERKEWMVTQGGPVSGRKWADQMLGPVIGTEAADGRSETEWDDVCARLVEFARRRWLVERMALVSAALRVGLLDSREAVARLRDQEAVT